VTHLGYYPSEEAAARIYDQVAVCLNGESAHTNFPYEQVHAVLCCAVLCCAVLCCAVLCCAVLCCAVLPVLRLLCCARCVYPHPAPSVSDPRPSCASPLWHHTATPTAIPSSPLPHTH